MQIIITRVPGFSTHFWSKQKRRFFKSKSLDLFNSIDINFCLVHVWTVMRVQNCNGSAQYSCWSSLSKYTVAGYIRLG